MSFKELTEYGTEEDVRKVLRDIPEDLSDVLSVEPALLIHAASRLHGLMAHWSTRMSVARGKYNASKSAREIGLELTKNAIKTEVLIRNPEAKITDAALTSEAKSKESYAKLCYIEAVSEAEYLRLKGLVEAIVMKRDTLRMLSYFVRPELDMSERSFSVAATTSEGEYMRLVGNGVRQEQANISNKLPRIKIKKG